MPVCITGMHRSGTSLVANLLQLCGLYLGQKHDLMQPSRDNQGGYWENLRFVAINDEILRQLGGAWDSPPVTSEGWEENRRFSRLRMEAEALIEEFRGREPWGWKDPRNCLTMDFWMRLNGLVVPFWLEQAPKLKVVICVRNPLEVFQSLRERQFTPSASGIDLWLTYNRNILNSTLLEDRIITHYEAYFDEPIAELRRVLEFLDLHPTDDLIAHSITAISKRMRHKLAKPDELVLEPRILDLFGAMCEEARYPNKACPKSEIDGALHA